MEKEKVILHLGPYSGQKFLLTIDEATKVLELVSCHRIVAGKIVEDDWRIEPFKSEEE